MEPDPRGLYEFGGFRLDARRRQLFSAASGKQVPLTPKAFETLLYFVEHRGELIDKATLLRVIWPDVTVEENNLNQNISALRRALGETPGEHRFIATAPGRGYRFVADVKTPTGEDKPRDAAPRAAIAPPSRTVVARASVAVLPFANLTGDPAKEYFSDGMAEELICTLSRTQGLKVPARTSSFAYRNRDIDVRQIGRELNVRTVLEGSVRSAGERVRVTAQLIDADTGFHLWSQNYDRKFEDLFALQDELAAAIAEALQMHLGQRVHPTEDLDAYSDYLRGRALWARLRPSGVEAAVGLFKQATKRDPNFARALSAQADVQFMLVTLGHATPETLIEAQEAAERAIALEPDFAEPHAVLGALHAHFGRWLDAEAYFNAAISLDQTDGAAHILQAIVLDGACGRLQRGLDHARRGYRLAPGFVRSPVAVACFHSFIGLDADALAYGKIAVDLGVPEAQLPLPLIRSTAARRAGRFAEAAEEIVGILPEEIGANGGAEAIKLIHAALEDRAYSSEAVTALAEVNAKADFALLSRCHLSILSLQWFVMLGALDEAYEIAERWLDWFARTGMTGYLGLAGLWLHELREFRRDPRFQRFVSRLGLIEYWEHAGPPDDCEIQNGVLICD